MPWRFFSSPWSSTCSSPTDGKKCGILFAFIINITLSNRLLSMAETKAKKVAPRRVRATEANSPIPEDKCNPSLRSLRFAGPTTHLSHDHAATAAAGVRHVWPASVVVGLAIILTASIAYTAVQAEGEQRQVIRSSHDRADVIRELRDINTRLGDLEQKVGQLSAPSGN